MNQRNLGKNYVIIISGGSNDIDKNSEKIGEVLSQTINTLRTGDADLRFYITTVQDG